MTGVADMADEDSDDSDIPALLDSDLPTLQAALDAADVLLEVVDARDISGTRCKAVEDLVTEADGQVFIVVNKIGEHCCRDAVLSLTTRSCPS